MSETVPGNDHLIALARGGDEIAFSSLVAQYQTRVYRLALRLTASESDAEDVLQETFLQVYLNLDTFRGDSQFSTWLFRIASNAALMRRRASKVRPTESLDDFLPEYNAQGRLARVDIDYGKSGRADELLEHKQLAQHALQGLDAMDEPYRAVFVLRDLESLSTEETAEILGITVEAVRQRLHRARLLLRGYLGHWVGEAP